MYKRVFSVFMVGLLSMLGAEAEAHYLISTSGKLYWHSLRCDNFLKGVQNPATNPAAVVCTVTGQEIEILCQNPQNHNVNPGNAGTQTFTGSDQIDQGDITGKGKATVSVIIDTDSQLLNPEFCVNPNWNPIIALVRRASVDLKTFECIDASCAQLGDLASTTLLDCVLPAMFNFDNPPVPDVTEYSCTEISRVHVN